MNILNSEEKTIFRIALNRELTIAAQLDEKAGGYYTRICNAIEQKVESAISRAAVVDLIGKLQSYDEPGSRTIAIEDVVKMLETL